MIQSYTELWCIFSFCTPRSWDFLDIEWSHYGFLSGESRLCFLSWDAFTKVSPPSSGATEEDLCITWMCLCVAHGVASCWFTWGLCINLFQSFCKLFQQFHDGLFRFLVVLPKVALGVWDCSGWNHLLSCYCHHWDEDFRCHIQWPASLWITWQFLWRPRLRVTKLMHSRPNDGADREYSTKCTQIWKSSTVNLDFTIPLAISMSRLLSDSRVVLFSFGERLDWSHPV